MLLASYIDPGLGRPDHISNLTVLLNNFIPIKITIRATMRTSSREIQSNLQCTQSLTLKGLHQAERNDSQGMYRFEQSRWSLFGGTAHCHRRFFSSNNFEAQPQDAIIERDGLENQQPESPRRNDMESKSQKKSVSFRNDPNDEGQKKSFTISRPVSTGRSKQMANRQQKSEDPVSPGKELSQEELEGKHRFLRECYSIEKYFNKIKPYTRTMPNTAMKLFYDKPCLESYGRGNTSGNNGFIYNDYLKTHNTQPHRFENEPTKYQTYRSALSFGKRAKLDLEEKWRKIHRQMVNKLDMKTLVEEFSEGFIPTDESNIDQILKFNINSMKAQKIPRSKSLDYLNRSAAVGATLKMNETKGNLNSTMNTTRVSTNKDRQENDEESRISSLKRSKSWGKKEYLFLYKFKNAEGDVQYAKDRHGITCYVDPTFEENREAFTKYVRKRAPIEAEEVKPGDRNIDRIMIANYAQAEEEKDKIGQHYLLPNCDEPYRPEKYSLKARKKSMMTMASMETTNK